MLGTAEPQPLPKERLKAASQPQVKNCLDITTEQLDELLKPYYQFIGLSKGEQWSDESNNRLTEADMIATATDCLREESPFQVLYIDPKEGVAKNVTPEIVDQLRDLDWDEWPRMLGADEREPSPFTTEANGTY